MLTVKRRIRAVLITLLAIASNTSFAGNAVFGASMGCEMYMQTLKGSNEAAQSVNNVFLAGFFSGINLNAKPDVLQNIDFENVKVMTYLFCKSYPEKTLLEAAQLTYAKLMLDNHKKDLAAAKGIQSPH